MAGVIESRLDPATDGTGGGYGRYPGLTVEAIAERFRFLVEEGEGRSARAILRLVYEQTEARGGLGTQRLLTALAVLAGAGLFVLSLVVAPEARPKLLLAAEVAAGLAVLFALGAASVHRATVRANAQVREIRRLALVALDLLVAKRGFVAKGLEREHLAALKSLRGSDRAAYERVSRELASGH